MGFCSLTHGVACPFEDLRRSRMLSVEDAAKFDDVKRNPAAAEEHLNSHKRRAGVDKEKRQDLLGGLLDLPLGGGLCKYLPKITKKERLWLTTNPVNGTLLLLTGVLAGIGIPTPQVQGLAEIPGNDPNHQFQAPGPTDVHGLCPTLNTLANHGYISRDGIGTRQSRCKKCQLTIFSSHPSQKLRMLSRLNMVSRTACQYSCSPSASLLAEISSPENTASEVQIPEYPTPLDLLLA
jgi:hypothetical protein